MIHNYAVDICKKGPHLFCMVKSLKTFHSKYKFLFNTTFKRHFYLQRYSTPKLQSSYRKVTHYRS